MSLQQVNLFQDELKTKSLNCSAITLVQSTLILISVLALIVVFQYVQLIQNESDLVEQQSKQKIAQAQLQKLQSELVLRKKNPILSKRVNDKNQELANKQNVFNILSRDEFGNTIGFIEHITGLARQRIDGLWLTQIRIAGGGTDVSLIGSTIKPALLPKYLQRLSAEKVFAGTEFKSFTMVRQEKKKQWLNFSLKNIKSAEVTP
ncbi:MAG: hypothetical protein QM484_07360 [Woeseiaceae bacterium]